MDSSLNKVPEMTPLFYSKKYSVILNKDDNYIEVTNRHTGFFSRARLEEGVLKMSPLLTGDMNAHSDGAESGRHYTLALKYKDQLK